MVTNTANLSDAETLDSLNRISPLRAATSRFTLLKLGFSLLRHWRLYADFLSPHYQQNNLARLQHLDSLGLPLSGKKILDVGAGIGDHTLFYLYRGCSVLPVDGRPDSVKALKRRLGIDAVLVDLDREPDKIERLGEFDFVHCYGLLYHLSNPRLLLSHIARTSATLLLETCVSFGDDLRLHATPEIPSMPSQALHGMGCRPSRQWVYETLQQYFPCVYATKTQPKHPEFPLDWTAPLSKSSRLARAVFVASHTAIESKWLLKELPMRYESW
jgi:SAM-dependent methyltransferase